MLVLSMALPKPMLIRLPPALSSIAAAWPKNISAPMIPTEMQALLGDMDKYTAAAEVVKEKSGGNTYMVASNGDFQNLFLPTAHSPGLLITP